MSQPHQQHPHIAASCHGSGENDNNESFWKQPSGAGYQVKLPGRVMKQNSREDKNLMSHQRSTSIGSKPATPTRGGQRTAYHQQTQQHPQTAHRRNNSTSFEVFTASCEDAWDSTIDDQCVGGRRNEVRTRDIQLTASTSVKTNAKSESSSSSSRLDCPVGEADPKLAKFKKMLLDDEVTDLNQLRSMAWAGIPNSVRPVTWKLLLGYLPVIRAKRSQVLERKRNDYKNLVEQYYNTRSANDEIWRQIHIDIPRMQPLISIFQQPVVQGIFERILYIWSIRHPASGYVQGMNDLVTPFFVTYLSEFIPGNQLGQVESFQVDSLPPDIVQGIEADSFWSFSKLLDSIQDNYTFAQPGIQRLVNLLSCVVSRVDRSLHQHLEKHNVQYLQFAFRWMNNLLIREMPLRCIVRLWDTYLAEGAVTTTQLPTTHVQTSLGQQNKEAASNNSDGNNWTMGSGTPFSSAFHLYVCAAFLRFWSKHLLQEKDFQGLMLLLQNLPTFHWTDNEVKLLVADAYQLKYTFSPNHLKI